MKYLQNYNGAKKERPQTDNTSSPAQPQRKLSVASPQPPKLMLSEEIDDAGVERHLKLLQKEEKKVHPNKHVVSELMKKTVPTFLETYSSLRHCDQVSIICTVI